MNSGDESFLSPYGEYEFGHTGNGAVKITYLYINTCTKSYFYHFIPLIYILLLYKK